MEYDQTSQTPEQMYESRKLSMRLLDLAEVQCSQLESGMHRLRTVGVRIHVLLPLITASLLELDPVQEYIPPEGKTSVFAGCIVAGCSLNFVAIETLSDRLANKRKRIAKSSAHLVDKLAIVPPKWMIEAINDARATG